MENGDTIYLTHRIKSTQLKEVHYYHEETPMGTIEELRQLLDVISQEVSDDTVVHLHLPAVTYEDGLSLNRRSINLYGSIINDRKTNGLGSNPSAGSNQDSKCGFYWRRRGWIAGRSGCISGKLHFLRLENRIKDAIRRFLYSEPLPIQKHVYRCALYNQFLSLLQPIL